MARINSLLPGAIQADLENLYGIKGESDKQLIKKKMVKKKKQVIKKEQEDWEKSTGRKHKLSKAEQDDKASREREKRELERKREAERLEKVLAREAGSHLEPDRKEEHFPLQQAVVLSEVIGSPKCKTRHRRER